MPQAMIEDSSFYQAGDATSVKEFSANTSFYQPNPAGTVLPMLPCKCSVKENHVSYQNKAKSRISYLYVCFRVRTNLSIACQDAATLPHSFA